MFWFFKRYSLPNYLLAPIILNYFSADHLYVLDILSAFKRLTLNVLLHKSCFLYTQLSHFLHQNFMKYAFVVISCEKIVGDNLV